MALVRNGTIDSVSVEFAPDPGDHEIDGVMVRNNALVGAVAFAFRPAHSAPILATREDNTPNTKETNMADTATPDTAAVDAVDRATLNDAIDELKREIVTFNTSHTDTEPVRRTRQLPVARRVRAGSRERNRRCKAPHPCAVRPGHRRQPRCCPARLGSDRVRHHRPWPPHRSTRSVPPACPDSGMDINWPYFDGDLTAIVADPVRQKRRAINSVAVSIKKGTAEHRHLRRRFRHLLPVDPPFRPVLPGCVHADHGVGVRRRN